MEEQIMPAATRQTITLSYDPIYVAQIKEAAKGPFVQKTIEGVWD